MGVPPGRQAVLEEIARVYPEVSEHVFETGDQWVLGAQTGLVTDGSTPEGALWLPHLGALLELRGPVATFMLRLAPSLGSAGENVAPEWVAEGGDGRGRRVGRGQDPWDAVAAWLIASRPRPL